MKKLNPPNSLNSKIIKPIEHPELTPEEMFSLMACLDEYHRTFILLRQYDEGKTLEGADGHEERYHLESDKANLIIKELKKHLAKNDENIEDFGDARGDGGVEKILPNIYQTWEDKELYPDLEDKAAYLFYSLIKDHLFTNGNKRIATFLLLWFMEMNDILIMGRDDRTLSYNIVYVLAVFVSNSEPKDKDIIVKLIHSFVSSHRQALPE